MFSQNFKVTFAESRSHAPNTKRTRFNRAKNDGNQLCTTYIGASGSLTSDTAYFWVLKCARERFN